MTAALMGWQDEDDAEHRRRMRNAMWLSLVVHLGVVAIFAAAPNSSLVRRPSHFSVELVAAAPAVAPATVSRSKPVPVPVAHKSIPRPAPSVQAAPRPPVVQAPVQILPEESPGRIRKATPPPKLIAKPKPVSEPVVWRPPREQELDYRDAMAALDDELGVDETAALLTPAPTNRKAAAAATAAEAPLARSGPTMTPELAAWNRATQRLIQSKWVTPASDRGRGLATSLELRLAASGALLGSPRIVRSSGDPFFDDNAVRALLIVAPLPPVAEPGTRIFIFRSEEN
ncbi:MAG: TonB C-terminal domain-containing protein [Myxococcota bacterium]